MRRRFNDSERVALYIAAEGRCQSCGAELGSDWHADHVQPFSLGGSTDVINGQALCANCNLMKGNRVSELYEWQEHALRRLQLAKGGTFVATATPGAGKTRFALAVARHMLDDGSVSRVIVVCPTSHLRRQWAEAASRHAGIQLDPGFENGAGAIRRSFDGVAVTYQSVASQPLLYRNFCASPTLVVLDEIHHAGEDEHLTWGQATREAFDPARFRLLLSGTLFREDSAQIPFVSYEDGHARYDYRYSYGDALTDGVVRPITFMAFDGEMRWRDAGAVISTNLAEASRRDTSSALAAALDPKGDWITSVLTRADSELSRTRETMPDAGGLVIANGQPEARAYAKLLQHITGVRPAVAISDEPAASQIIERFSKGDGRWLVAVKMVSEGVDIPRLAIGVYAARTRTEMFFRQVVGRFVRKRDQDDENCATLLIPSVSDLLEFAATIEQERDHVLEAERDAHETERVRDERELTFDLIEPLGSSEAVHHSTIFSGDSLSDEELQAAEDIRKLAGLPPSVTPAQMARALRMAGRGQQVHAKITVERPTIPTYRTLQHLRAAVKVKVRRLAQNEDIPYSHIYADLKRVRGDRGIELADEEGLLKSLDWLDQRLGE